MTAKLTIWPQSRNCPLIRRVAILLIALTATVFAGSVQTASAFLPLAEDNFEEFEEGPTGHGWLDDWSFEGRAEITESGGPYEGDAHLRLREGGASATRSVELTGETSLRLRFWASTDDLEDGADVEVSANGSSYVTVKSWNEDEDDDEDYTFYDIDLATTGLTFTDQLWVRARIPGDEDDGELMIDLIDIISSGEEPDPPPPPESQPIAVDGNFDDWNGKATLADAQGDQSGGARHDIAAIYWANNIDEEINYHMLERHTTDGQPFNGSNGQNSPARYILYIDTNNNGDYTDSDDRRAVITYFPKNSSSLVNVRIYRPDSIHKISDSGWNDWGDSRNEGGLRVEFLLDWNDLDIEFGGVIRMFAISHTGLSFFPQIKDRVPDGNADIQWSPASVLGPWLLGAASVAGMGIIWLISRRRRLWR